MFIRNLNYPLRKISYFRMIFDIGEREREKRKMMIIERTQNIRFK